MMLPAWESLTYLAGTDFDQRVISFRNICWIFKAVRVKKAGARKKY